MRVIGAGRAGIRSPSSDELQDERTAKGPRGGAPDGSPVALLIIDAINDSVFPEGPVTWASMLDSRA
jgi:hypothetical protein